MSISKNPSGIRADQKTIATHRDVAATRRAWDAAFRRYAGAAVRKHLTPEDLQALGFTRPKRDPFFHP